MKLEKDILKIATTLLQTDKKQAHFMLTNFVRDYPENWEGYLLLGASESLQQNYDAAVDNFQNANFLKPNNSLILYNIGYCYRQLGKILLGHYYYQQVFQLAKEKDPEIGTLLASTLCELGHQEKGRSLLKQIQQKCPHHPLADFYLFLIDNCSSTSPIFPKIKNYAQSEKVINYLVSFSMKHDYYQYSALDNKMLLSRLIKNYQKFFQGTVQNFYPQTFILPDELEKLQNFHQKGCLWIIKYPNLSGGQGMEIIDSLDEPNLGSKPAIAQKYISEPLLLEERKFNLRTYLVIISLNPLKAYVWKDGLIFIAPQPFTLAPENLNIIQVHIANLLASGAGINNSHLKKFSSHVLSLKELVNSGYFTDKQVASLKAGIVKVSQQLLLTIQFSNIFQHQTLLSALGSYPPKFFGLDLMFDSSFSPWLLEVERYAGVGGVFPETQKINTRFKQHYFDLVTQLDFQLYKNRFLEITLTE